MRIPLRATTTLAATGVVFVLAVVLVVIDQPGAAPMPDAHPAPRFTSTPNAAAETPDKSCLQALGEPSLGLRPVALVADCERIDINGSPSVTSSTTRAAPAPTPTQPSTPTQPPSGTPVAVNGKLAVCGTKLCNARGTPVQLRGMSTHGIQWFRQCVNGASIGALANDWKADVVRISMYVQEQGYETNPRAFTDLVHELIEIATDRGLYTIVDWHMLEPGDPHHNLSRANTFFTEIASRHASKPNIIYEVANEPSGVSWSRIKDYHEQIIPVIRAKDSDAVILLGTRAWSSLGVSDGASESEVISDPVQATNVMYTFHFYAASHGGTYLNALSRAADRIPMFVTEFGTQTFTGDGGNDFAMAQRYIDLMAAKKIGWVNWNFSDSASSGAVFTDGTCPNGPFAGTSRLKPAGVWVRERIRANR